MRSIFAVTLLLALGAGSLAATGDIELPCSQITSIEPIWLNSSTQATKFVGNGFYAYSTMPNGKIYPSTYPGLLFQDVAELGLIPTLDNSSTKCAVHVNSVEEAQSQGILYRNLNFAGAMCKLHSGERMLRPTVLEKYIELTITRPDWPEFSMLQTFSLANDTVEMPVPPVNTTGYLNFSFFYHPTFPKYSLEIHNWNWSVQTPTSGLRLFFSLHAYTDEATTLTISTQDVPFYKFNFTTSKVSTQAVFARAFNADNIDYILTAEATADEHYPIPADLDITLPTAVSVCYLYQPLPTRYVNFNYDPSLQTIFVGDFTEITPDSPPALVEQQRKARLNPAAYAVPIVVVILVVIGIIALVMFVPSIRRKVLPGSVRDKSLRVTDSDFVARQTAHTTESSTPKPQASAKPVSNEGWRKSARPTDGALE